MKKFLAIILSIMMVLGACSVASFAFYEEDLPVIPEQKEGCIYFAAGNVYVEAGKTYDVPVYMISDVKTDITEGFVELGFSFYLMGFDGAKVNSVTFADGIKAFKNFYPIESHFGWTSDDYDAGETFHDPDPSIGYVAFAADVTALNQSKIQVATINVTIPENFEGEDSYVSVNFTSYDFTLNSVGYWFEGNGGIFEGAFTADDMDANEGVDPAVVLEEGTIDGGDIFYSFGYMVEYHEPPMPSWKQKLVDWFQDTVDGILTVFETIHEYIRTVVALLDQLV